MKNSKLIQLLSTFKEAELDRFQEYLASPFFNKKPDQITFYLSLRKALLDLSPESLEKQILWQYFQPEKPYDEKELGYLLSDLYKHAENFIAIHAFQSDEVSKGIEVITYHLHHRLEKQFRSRLNAAVKELEKAPFRDADWNYKSWKIAKSEILHFYSSKSRKPGTSFARANQHLDSFFFNNKLEMGVEVLNRNQILEAGLDTGFIDHLRTFLGIQPVVDPAVEIRKLTLETLQQPLKEESFKALKAKLHLCPAQFPPDKAKGIFAYAENFCIRKIKSGELRYQSELFQIYELSIRLGMVYESGALSPWKFKNICAVALKLEKFEWTQAFIDSQANKIPKKFRKDAVTYNIANLHFHLGEYNLALRQLHKVEFTDVFYALDTRRMMAMIYLDQEDYESLFFLVSAFRSYLRRNKVISPNVRLSYKNFVDWINRISRAEEKGKQKVWKPWLEEIKNTSPLVEGDWLLKKCRQNM